MLGTNLRYIHKAASNISYNQNRIKIQDFPISFVHLQTSKKPHTLDFTSRPVTECLEVD
jgi:hypothetical protein